MNVGTKATLTYVGMIFAGIAVVTLSTIDPSFSLDPIPYNLPKLLFNLGSAVSIMGLHELCHCLYCQIKGIRIIGVLGGLKDIGIKVEEPHPPGVPLSSLFSILITTTVSAALGLPLWIVLFNTGVACIYCRDDIRHFLKERNSKMRARDSGEK